MSAFACVGSKMLDEDDHAALRLVRVFLATVFDCIP